MEPPPPKLLSKPSLITPSASPPPARYSSVAYRAPDSAPPNKRQRTATPRRTFHDSASSSNSRTQTPVLDVQKEREASMSRLRDVWAGLADRYCRDDEEDDIVDINTGEIITDNGFLRNTPALEFGSLAGAADEGTEADEAEDDEYDPDELDAWADVDSDGFDLHGDGVLDIHGKALPPVTIRDPSDAADLRAFLEAEKQRKPLSEDSDEDAGSARDVSLEDVTAGGSEDETVEHVSVRQKTTLDRNEDPGTTTIQSVPHGDGHEEGYSDYLVPLDVSGDELDNWEEDESNAIQTLTKEEDQTPAPVPFDLSSDSEIEIVDGPFVPKSNARDKKRPLPKARPPSPHSQSTKPPLQLYTPPQSSSSYAPSSSPAPVEFNNPPHPSSFRPPDISSSEKVFKSSTKSLKALRNEETSNSTPPKLDLAKFRRRKTPQREYSKVPNLSSDNGGGTSPPPLASPSPRKLVPVVEITVQKHMKQPGSTKQLHRLPASDIQQQRQVEPSKPPLSKGKGKEKETVATPKPAYNTRASKKTSPSDKLNELRGEESASQEENNLGSLEPRKSKETPPTSKSTIKGLAGSKSQNVSPRKRKRVVSDTEDEVDATASSPQLPPDPPKLTLRRAPSLAFDLEEGPSHRQQRPPSHRGMRRKKRKSPSISEDDSASDVSEHFDRPRGRRSQSRSSTLPPTSQYLYPHGPYMSHPTSQAIPAIHDPRAQLIIAQAMHQLSALVGTPWPLVPSYLDGEVPRTPSRRGQSMQPPNFPYTTPTHHPHPYSYAFDPSFSRATLPPDSPEPSSSPEKSSKRRPKTLVRRSRSRGRNVSFRVDEDDFIEMEERSSSPMMGSSPLKGKKPNESGNVEKFASKAKAKVDAIYEEVPDSEESEDGRHRTRLFSRGQTPGPSSDAPEPRRRGRG